jgi:hypothetical protein
MALMIIIAAVETMKSVDEKYKISENVTAAGAQAKAKLVELDEKYELTNKTSALIQNTQQKMHDMDNGYRVSERVNNASTKVAVYVREVDSKLAVSATAGRIVQAGTAAIVAAYNRAVEFDQAHRLSERAAATLAAGASVVASKVSKLSTTGSPGSPSENNNSGNVSNPVNPMGDTAKTNVSTAGITEGVRTL